MLITLRARREWVALLAGNSEASLPEPDCVFERLQFLVPVP
jgi:hypothetical protein